MIEAIWRLAQQIVEAPTAPPTTMLDALTDHIAEIIRSGNPVQRKTFIEALVAEVKVTGRGAVIPVFGIPSLGSPVARLDK